MMADDCKFRYLTFHCYGAAIVVASDVPGSLILLRDRLPPHAENVTLTGDEVGTRYPESEVTFRIARRDEFTCTVDIESESRTLSVEEAVCEVADRFDIAVSERSRNVVFVHAGAVAWKGHGIVIPGRTHAGKSTLVRALIDAGATYYSDEFAVIDEAGRLLPYARRLALRDTDGYVTRHTAASLGASTGEDPTPIRLIVSTRYVSGAVWQPQAMRPGQAVLKLFDNTIQARAIPGRALDTFAVVMASAVAIEGLRGDAATAAREILSGIADL